MFVILFGVSGAGKTTLGESLARELGWHFYEADDFHSRANIGKMRRGIPLTDEDRRPWLEKLRQLIDQCLSEDGNGVLACSALKRAYRDQLRVSEQVRFVFLRADYALISAQLRNRHGHFMNPALLKSQFADLEEPGSDEHVLTVDLGGPPEELVDEIKVKLCRGAISG